ncbi:hypothetical protein JCM11641_001756 [Rhodosporidiobolus odoratus]
MAPKRKSRLDDDDDGGNDDGLIWIPFSLELHVYQKPLLQGLQHTEKKDQNMNLKRDEHGWTFDREVTPAAMANGCREIINKHSHLTLDDDAKLRIFLFTPRSSYCTKDKMCSIFGPGKPITSFVDAASTAGHTKGTIVVYIEYDLPEDEGDWESCGEEEDQGKKKKGKGGKKGGTGKKKAKAVDPSPYTNQNTHRGSWTAKIRQKYPCTARCKNSFHACIVFPSGRHLVLTAERISVWCAQRFSVEQKHLEAGVDEDGLPETGATTAAQSTSAAHPPAPAPPTMTYNTYYGVPGAAPPANQQHPPQPAPQGFPFPSSSAPEYEDDNFALFLDTGSYKSKPEDKARWKNVLEVQEIGTGEFEAVKVEKWEEWGLPGGSVLRFIRAFAAFKKAKKEGVWARPGKH